MTTVNVCNRVIRVLLYLLIILVPLILTPWNYELFEFNKMVIVYAITTLVMTTWLVKTVYERKITIAKTPLDIPIGLFVVSQLTSSIFSIDRHLSWFGYYSRFNGGMWSIICYVILYYAFVTHFTLPLREEKNEAVEASERIIKNITRLLYVVLGTAFIVTLYGFLERLGIDKSLWVQDVQNRVFSFLGQPNWLAAYLVSLIPLSTALFLKVTKKGDSVLSPKVLLWSLFSTFLFIVTLFTRSRSGLLGFAASDLLLAAFILYITKFSRATWVRLAFIHALFFVVIFFNGTYIDAIDSWISLSGLTRRFTHTASAPTTPSPQVTAPALETGGTESGTIRKYVWQAAIDAWKSTPKTQLIGTGTETFALAFYQFKPLGHNLTSEWDFLYNKAHNEYLNYLATTGIFGLGSYLLIIGIFIMWIARAMLNPKTRPSPVSLGLIAGWISILITNFFGFSVVIIQLFFFLFPATIYILHVATNPKKYSAYQSASFTLPKRLEQFLLFTIVIIGMVQIIMVINYWRADTLFATGYRANKSGDYALATSTITQAMHINGSEPYYHDELASALSGLALALASKNEASQASAYAQQSIDESTRAITISPRNVNYWKTRTKVFYNFSAFDPQFNTLSIEAIRQAYALSPHDPKIVYNLAILEGREGHNDKSIELLKQAIALKKDYRDAYVALTIFYDDAKQHDKSIEVMKQYLQTVNPADKEFIEKTQ